MKDLTLFQRMFSLTLPFGLKLLLTFRCQLVHASKDAPSVDLIDDGGADKLP